MEGGKGTNWTMKSVVFHNERVIVGVSLTQFSITLKETPTHVRMFTSQISIPQRNGYLVVNSV